MKRADFVDAVDCTITSQCKNVKVKYFQYISDLFVVSTLQFCKQSTNADKYCGLKHLNKSFTWHNLLVYCLYHPTWSKQETENEVDVAKLCNLRNNSQVQRGCDYSLHVHESYIIIRRDTRCLYRLTDTLSFPIAYWLIVHVLVIHKHWVIIKSASLSGQENSEDKNAFQLNANCPLSTSPCFIVNKFEHVHGGGALYRMESGSRVLYRRGFGWGLVQKGGVRGLHSEPPLYCGQNDWLAERHHWKHHLPTTSLAGSVKIQFHNFTEWLTDWQTPLKTSPSHNFAGRQCGNSIS